MSIQDLISQSLAQKYAILGQQADAQSIAAKAGANLDNIKANLMPGQVKADIGLTNANTMYTQEQTKFFGPTALANIANTNAGTRETLEGRLPLLKMQTTGAGLANQITKRQGLTSLSELLGIDFNKMGGWSADDSLRSIRGGAR